MKQVLFLLFFTFLFSFYSCNDPNTTDNNGALKVVITNNTDYDVKELYYKIGEPSYGSLGTKLNTEVLSDGGVIEFCPEKAGEYYFTFVRQNGSNDTNLYVSSEKPLNLELNSGIVRLELLPFNFYYDTVKNNSFECRVGN